MTQNKNAHHTIGRGAHVAIKGILEKKVVKTPYYAEDEDWYSSEELMLE